MPADVQGSIDALLSSTHRLKHSIANLADDDVRGPSLLPGWTRGHVLAHLARNADALVNLATWARTGEETPMYPSRAERNAAIEAGAGRPARELVADVDDSHERFMAAIDAMAPDDFESPIRFGAADRKGTGAVVPVLRRIEVEVHHVDLDLDYTLAHWPEDFVEFMLGEVAADYSSREGVSGFVLVGNDDEGRWVVGDGGPEINGPPPALLGWLIGRSEGTGLHSDSGLPALEPWR